jgi:hypothetical protein
VCNPVLDFLFHTRQAEMLDCDSKTVYKYHGSDGKAIQSIIHDGFRLPTQHKNGGLFGKG